MIDFHIGERFGKQRIDKKSIPVGYWIEISKIRYGDGLMNPGMLQKIGFIGFVFGDLFLFILG